MFRLVDYKNKIPKVEFFGGALGEVFLYGEALILAGGRREGKCKSPRLTRCPQNQKPQFICLNDVSCRRSSKTVAVYRIMDEYIFECPIDEASDLIKAGDKACLSDDGLGIIASPENKTAEVVEVVGGKAKICF